MKTACAWLLAAFFPVTLLMAHAAPAAEARRDAPAGCEACRGAERRSTCLNARAYGLSMEDAAMIEDLAEHDHAVIFCGHEPDPADTRRTETILAGGAAFRGLYDAHRKMLETRCVYDPAGWCRSMGLERR